MRLESIIKTSRKLSRPFRVSQGEEFRLKDVDAGDTLGFGPDEKRRARQMLAMGIEALTKPQDMLYARDRWAVLVAEEDLRASLSGHPPVRALPEPKRRGRAEARPARVEEGAEEAAARAAQRPAEILEALGGRCQGAPSPLPYALCPPPCLSRWLS